MEQHPWQGTAWPSVSAQDCPFELCKPAMLPGLGLCDETALLAVALQPQALLPEECMPSATASRDTSTACMHVGVMSSPLSPSFESCEWLMFSQ